MEYKKGLMKDYLAENLRLLMLQKPYEKITIKNICDETGVIRATFYNYFLDKYDALDYIVYCDTTKKVLDGSNKKDFFEMVTISIESIEEQIKFYQIALRVSGQNGFEDILCKYIAQGVGYYLEQNRADDTHQDLISNQLLADWYAQGLTYLLIKWIKDNKRIGKEDVVKTVEIFTNEAISSFVNKNK